MAKSTFPFVSGPFYLLYPPIGERSISPTPVLEHPVATHLWQAPTMSQGVWSKP